jgi:hypothetical protein
MKEKLTTKQIQDLNEERVIQDLGVVAWARSSELVLWSPDGRSQQEEIIRRCLVRLKESGFVQSINLPGRSGTGYFLTKKGENLCKKKGFPVSTAGHEPSRPAARFHEHILTMIALSKYKKMGYQCYFARDLAWAPDRISIENGKEVPVKLLKGDIIYKHPPKMVDAFAFMKDTLNDVTIRCYFETEWSVKDGKKMWSQIRSFEEILKRTKDNRVVLIYPSDPDWQTEFLRKIGKAWKAPNHEAVFINYMRKSKILMEKASQVFFLPIPLEGNFKLTKEPTTFSLQSYLNKEVNDFIKSEIEGWKAKPAFFEYRETRCLTHTASGAQLTIGMQPDDSFCEEKPGWYYHLEYTVQSKNSASLLLETTGGRLEFEGKHYIDDWDFVMIDRIRWALRAMFMDPNCSYKPRKTSAKNTG